MWFDAHSDLATPDETTSGYFDGMGVSMLKRTSWKALLETVPGYRLLGLEKVVFCGVRDLDERQFDKLEQLNARVVYGDQEASEEGYAAEINELLRQDDSKGSCVVHFDVDCLDTSIGTANEYVASGGLLEEDLAGCLDVVIQRRKPIALTVALFNPNLVGGDNIAEAAIKAIVQLISAV